MAVKPIPDGYHTATPYLIVRDARRALEFYPRAFGAQETGRFEHDGKIGHAEIKIGDSPIMLADEYPDRNILGPESLGGSTVGICLYVEDSDAWYERALSAGCEVLKPIQDQFYGHRSGTVKDPFGHWWTLASVKEEVTPEELERRVAAMGQPG